MRIAAIDPGTTESGWVLFEDGRVLAAAAAMPNVELHELVAEQFASIDGRPADLLAIEMIASFGMAVGESTFRTVWWTGRFAERWLDATGCLPMEVLRQEVKLHVCKSVKANDSNIRVALMDLIGPKGTKADPGPTFLVASHAWQALGVAVTAIEKLGNQSA